LSRGDMGAMGAIKYNLYRHDREANIGKPQTLASRPMGEMYIKGYPIKKN